MKVSVIIPVFNEEKVIIPCLKSLGAQTLKDIEVILVDDGSSDKTLKLISDFKDYPVNILKTNHKGPGAARNIGTKKTKGEILIFVDSDMTFDSKFLEKLIAPIIDKRAKGTFSKEEYVANWENPIARCWNINEGWEDKKRHPKNYPDTQKVFRAILKAEFEKVNGFTPGGYNDDWSLASKLGYEAQNAPGAIFYHQNPDSWKEVFNQAKWIGKRKYKLGIVGYFLAMVRASLPVSLVIGFAKFIVTGESGFVVFKVIYDFGIIIGIIEYLLGNKAK